MSTTFGKMLTYCLTQSYLLKRWIYYASVIEVFLGNLSKAATASEIFQKQPPKVFYEKSCP